MNKELRWKLARMILDRSRTISTDPEVYHYFENIGFERAHDGWEVEEGIAWQATPPGEGPHLLFKPDGNRLYFAVTAPMLTAQIAVMKIDVEVAEKILALGGLP